MNVIQDLTALPLYMDSSVEYRLAHWFNTTHQRFRTEHLPSCPQALVLDPR